ncbi:MAG: MFS transporter, partial [Cyanobacteria bacterium]|nr:MFS transporter [Cyanobacteriota bacterium]
GAYLVGQYFRSARRGMMVFGGFTVTGLCLILLCAVDGFPRDEILLASPQIKTSFLYLAPVLLTTRMIYTYSLVALMGIGAAFVAIPLQALLHELIPEDKRGKILGVQFTILSTASTLPALIAGLGAEYFGVRPMFWMIGIPTLILGLRGLYHRIRQKNATTPHW